MARRDGRDLDAEARAAGFPGGRKEREAYRRSVKAGKAAPGPRYRPLPPGAPGGRGRKAPAPPASRSKNIWHPLGDPANPHGRVKSTSSSANALSAIKGASRNRELVYLTVKADVTAKYVQKLSDQGEAGFREGIDPGDLLAAIDAAGGDVRQGIADALMATGDYDKVGNIRSITIRAYK